MSEFPQFAEFNPTIPDILPHGKMYHLQLGDKLFILRYVTQQYNFWIITNDGISGASLSSDAPSYFTNYFLESSKEGPLFIDRSPEVFEYIYQHLQGYHVEIPNGDIYTKLYTDSIYFNLPRLKKLLLDDDFYYITMSGESLKVPKKLITTEGNYPNYFSVTFDSQYRDLTDVMISKNLLRPPPQASLKLHRDVELFKDLLRLLQGVEIDLSENRRRALIKEAKYYRFNAIVENLSCVKIIKDEYFQSKEYIVVKISDLDVKNLIIEEEKIYDDEINNKFGEERNPKRIKLIKKHVKYKRKYGIDSIGRDLIIEIDSIIGVLIRNEGKLNNKFKLPKQVSTKLGKVKDRLKNLTNSSPSFKCEPEFLNLSLIKEFIINNKEEDDDEDEDDITDNYLLKKSFWKLKVDIDEEGFNINYIPIKLDIAPFNESELYNIILW